MVLELSCIMEPDGKLTALSIPANAENTEGTQDAEGREKAAEAEHTEGAEGAKGRHETACTPDAQNAARAANTEDAACAADAQNAAATPNTEQAPSAPVTPFHPLRSLLTFVLPANRWINRARPDYYTLSSRYRRWSTAEEQPQHMLRRLVVKAVVAILCPALIRVSRK